MRKLLVFLVLFLASLTAVAQTTPTYGFNVPPFNTQNWGTLMNQNWYMLDALLTAGGTTLPVPSSGGLCFVSTGNSAGDWGWITCPGGGGGFVNPMTTFGDSIVGNTSGAAARLAGVTDHNGVPQFMIQQASGGIPGAQGWKVAGVPPNTQVGAYTILSTDRLKKVNLNNASTTVVTIPAPTGDFDLNFAFLACTIGAGKSTLHPSGATLTVSNGTGYVTGDFDVTTGQCVFVYSDNTNYQGVLVGGSGGGGGGTGSTSLSNCTSDQTGNSNWVAGTLTNWFNGHWEFTKNVGSAIYCEVYVPTAQAGATLVLDIFANDATAGHTASWQTCDNVANGNLQVGSLTCASAQTFTTTTTAYQQVTLTFNVQTALVSGKMLVVKILTSTSGTAPTNNMMVYPHFIL